MVGLEILVKIQPEKRFEFMQTFEFMTQTNHKARDCIEQTLFEKSNESNSFLWIEDWKNSESLESYRQTEKFRSLLGAMEVLGSLVKIRTFTFIEE
ncbi:MAG: antibiotic biosynthesis monooxygenase [Deltaproteobacteria bacterium]|nr:antibiotic biosynthesis monooxygenase [Deltaproteobacteria bacterium]MBW2327249.1 antibiotic biosynthesis monooxygenase [Deltaproteobacteria bacterium]